MRLLHLSDLHLGKRINDFSMLEDQSYILDQLLTLQREEKVHGVLVAGDIYDKASPSVEAVQLWDEFLAKTVEQGVFMCAVSGNHDSAVRIAYGGRIMQKAGVYLSPAYVGPQSPICMEDEYGQLEIHLLPFLKPAIVRHALNNEEISSYTDAIRCAVEALPHQKGVRSVLVAHQFVTGARQSDSEEISVGGVDHVPAEIFDAFDYVALGHLHRPQFVARETLRYCGTPLKYSLSEAEDRKCGVVVELHQKGEITIQEIPLMPLRDLREISGTYEQVTNRSFYEKSCKEDYLFVTLKEEEEIPFAMEKLRSIYPNIMRLTYDNARTCKEGQIEASLRMEEKTPLELFEELYEQQNNGKMSEQQRKFVVDTMQKIWEGEE